jgi:hypothetical protein
MLLWPEQIQTSPNKTLVAVIAGVGVGQPAVQVAVMLYVVKPAVVTGSSARKVVSLPSAWSGAIVAGTVWPLKEKAMDVAEDGAKPHTMACLGAAARIELEPEATANRKGGGGVVAVVVDRNASEHVRRVSILVAFSWRCGGLLVVRKAWRVGQIYQFRILKFRFNWSTSNSTCT